MRSLKFRVWYENVKRGEKKGDEIVWSTKSYYDYSPIIDNGGLLEVEGGWDIWGNSDENYVIEQYTGLKDKNGKEIYEGDILEFDKDFDDSAQRYVPYFDEKLAAFGFRIYGYQYYISESGSEEFESEMSLISEMENYEREEIIFYTEYISRVGNIHENPELLGGEEEE